MKILQTIYDYNTKENYIQEVVLPNVIEEIPEYIPSSEERLNKVEEDNTIQDELINISLLATDEMFMMLEPLLEVVQINERGLSKMVDMYVAMIMRGLKTIDEIPLRYREEVKQIIEQLER